MNTLIETVYDNAKAFSLRDRDIKPEDIEDVGRVIRMRLGCRAAENLMLSNEVLAIANTDWISLQAQIAEWVTANSSHKYHGEMRRFVNEGYNRKDFDLKDIRNIILGLISTKPWEVLVGQAIAALLAKGEQNVDEGSLRNYLGEKVSTQLLKMPT